MVVIILEKKVYTKRTTKRVGPSYDPDYIDYNISYRIKILNVRLLLYESRFGENDRWCTMKTCSVKIYIIQLYTYEL